MSEHYFVVRYDPASGWQWDTDTESARFDEGTIWVDGQWVRSGKIYGTAQHKLYDIDEQASEALGKCMQIMNENKLPNLEEGK